MAVNEPIRIAGPFVGDGVLVELDFDFETFAVSDVSVVVTNADGVDATLEINTHYTVTLNSGSAGGSVTLLSALATGTTANVYGDAMAYTRTGNIISNPGGFFPAIVNAALDRVHVGLLQLAGTVGRALLLPRGEDGLTLPAIGVRAGKVLGFDAGGGATVVTLDDSLDGSLRADLADGVVGGAALVGNQLPAGSDLRTQPVSEFIEGGALMPSQFGGTDEQRLTRAIVEAGTVRDSALGQQVLIPRGIITTTAAFNMANRAMLVGVNKRGSIIQADAAHTGPSMVTVINGASSTFDNRLQDLTLDCNDVAGLSGVISSAWQEGGGLRDVLIQKFTGCGLDIVDTIGGVSQLLIENSEFFGSEDGALSCIRYDDPSLVSSAILMMSNLAVTGGVPVAADTDPARATARAGMPVAVDIINGSSTSTGVHVEVAEIGFRLDGNGRHIIIGAKGSAPNGTTNAGVETLVEIAATFTGTLTMIGCSRNGATNFVKDNRVGGVGTISYDMPEFKISLEPPVYPGSLVARGWFVASNDVTPDITNCRGVASVTRDSNGQWTIVTTRSLASIDDWVIPMPSIATNGLEPPSVEILGVNSFRFKLRTLGGTPTGTPAIHFTAFHL